MYKRQASYSLINLSKAASSALSKALLLLDLEVDGVAEDEDKDTKNDAFVAAD